MAAKSISIPVTGNTAPLRKSLTSAEKQLQRFKREAQANMKSAAQSFALAGAAAGGLAFTFYEGFQRAEQANQRVFAIAKSMRLFGGETGKVTRRLIELGDQLERETGLTAESIKETQAKLLTFSQIARTADEAGGAFDRATQAAIDLSAAGFGEVTSNAVQLGKALQDPIKGITALARSGISFTQAEKEKIRTLVESNRILEAQDMILSAVETQVGGTAVATVTATTKIRNSIGEVSDVVGQALAPTFEEMALIFQDFAEWAGKNEELVAVLGTALIALPAAILVVKGAMAAATAVSAAYAAAQAAVAAGNLAVQASTIVGIATAGVAAAAIVTLTAKVYGAVKANKANADSVDAMSEAYDRLRTGPFGFFYRTMDTLNKLAADYAAEQAAAADLAKEKENERFRKLKENLEDAKKAIRAYVAEIATAINREVSLNAAFSDAADSQLDASQQISQALQERRDAYAELQQAQATGDTKAYAAALDKVAASESKVADAQAVKPKNYAQVFAEQIAAAKQFAGYIKQLAPLLSRGALQQILDLGPVAGAQVAKDLLSGTGGMSIASLNADIADIATTGTAAGMAIPGYSEALGATAARNGGDFYITIEAGVSSPTDIAKTVQSVLQTYGATNGGVAVKTKQPKASAGRRRR